MSNTAQRLPLTLRPRLTDLIVLGVAVHLAAASLLALQPHPDDTKSFLKLARALCMGRGYINAPMDPVPTAHRPPVYPALLAGLRLVSPETLIPERVVQALIALLLAPAVGWMVAGAFPQRRRWALWAGVLALWYPPFIVGGGQLLSEPLFTLWVVLTLGCVWRSMAGRTWWYAVAAGLLGALATLTRGNGLALLPCITLAWLVLGPCRKQAIVFTVAAGLALLPWIVRNYMAFGGFVPSTTITGIVLWQGMNPAPEGYGYSDWEGLTATMDRLGVLADEDGRQYDELTKSRALTDYTLQQMRADPARTAQLAVLKLAWLFYPYTGSTYWPVVRVGDWSLGHYNPVVGLLLCAALVGVWGMGSQWRWLWPAWVALLATILLAVIIYGQPRFRHPTDPALLVLALAGVGWLQQQPRRRQKAVCYCVVLVNLVLFVADERPKAAVRSWLTPPDKTAVVLPGGHATDETICACPARQPDHPGGPAVAFLPSSECPGALPRRGNPAAG